MSKLSSNQEILDIHAMLDTPPSVEQIHNVIEKELETVQDVVRYLVSVFAISNERDVASSSIVFCHETFPAYPVISIPSVKI